MFVYRVAGPSRLALPVKLAHKRSKKTIFLTNGGFGCLFVVQRHMSRTSRNSTLGMRNPQDVRSENKDMGDVEEIKRQARLIAKNGKRGQETKPIDAQVFPTLGQLSAFTPFEKDSDFAGYRCRVNRVTQVSTTALLPLHASQAPRLADIRSLQPRRHSFRFYHPTRFSLETHHRASTTELGSFQKGLLEKEKGQNTAGFPCYFLCISVSFRFNQ